MSFTESSPLAGKQNYLVWALVCTAVVVVLGLAVLVARNQPEPANETLSAAATAPQNTASASGALTVQPGPKWHELDAAQRSALKPLAATWNALGLAQKNKWIALSKNFPSRSAEDQARLQERMVEWAALSPREREVARLNFAETKKLPAGNLAASWAAYQELSPEEKSRLAAKAADKPTGASIAIAPTPNDKIVAVPITRRTSPTADPAVLLKPQLDPNTLLPKIQIPPAPAETPSAGAEPAASSVVSSDTLSPN